MNCDAAGYEEGEQQWLVEHLHAYHAHADVQQAQEEKAEQQAVPVNELANQDTMGQEVGEQQEALTIRTLHFTPTLLKLMCSMLAMLWVLRLTTG